MTAGAGAAQPGVPSSRPMDRVTRWMVFASIVVLFAVSGGVLWVVGYNYDGLTGSAVTKIHPFTYLIVATTLVRAITFGNPIGYLVHVFSRRPAAVLLALIGTILFAVTILRKAPGMAGMIDTFISPALLVMLLADAGDILMERIETALHVIMTANALLAVFEFASKFALFPYRFDGTVFPADGRASALQGHPLANALVTTCYVLALLAGARSLSLSLKLPMVVLQGVALVCFGGRAGMVAFVVLGGIFLVHAAFDSLRAGRIPLLPAAVGLLLLGTVPAIIAAAAQAGFFDALLSRFVSDGGSANARVEMLEVFKGFSLSDLIIGPDIGLVESLRRVNGLELGIENPILRMILYQGGFLTLATTIAVGLFLRECIKVGEPGALLPLVAAVVLLNTSESISVKSTGLAKLAILFLCLYRRPVARRVASLTAAARSVRARRPILDRGHA